MYSHPIRKINYSYGFSHELDKYLEFHAAYVLVENVDWIAKEFSDSYNKNVSNKALEYYKSIDLDEYSNIEQMCLLANIWPDKHSLDLIMVALKKTL